jgi:glutaredoxin 3
MKSVAVYTTDSCSYCASAKALLAKRGIVYEETNLAGDSDARQRLMDLTSMTSFPQIVIDGQPLGGFEQLLAADRNGQLTELLAAPHEGAAASQPVQGTEG